MKTAELEFDFTGLHNFVRFVDSAGKFVVKVGIFGNKTARGITDKRKAGKSGLRKVLKGTKATLTNADLLGMTGQLGTIAPVAFADLLLVDGDPLADIAVLTGQGERISLIMRGGTVFKGG